MSLIESFRRQFNDRVSVRRRSISFIIIAAILSLFHGKSVLAQGSSESRATLIDVQISDPRFQPNTGFATFAIRIRSLTGQPLMVGAPIYFNGWSAYISSGLNCKLSPSNIPQIKDGEVINLHEVRVGANAPLLVPTRIYCNGVKRGDDVSISFVLLVAHNGVWVPKQIAIDKKVL